MLRRTALAVLLAVAVVAGWHVAAADRWECGTSKCGAGCCCSTVAPNRTWVPAEVATSTPGVTELDWWSFSVEHVLHWLRKGYTVLLVIEERRDGGSDAEKVKILKKCMSSAVDDTGKGGALKVFLTADDVNEFVLLRPYFLIPKVPAEQFMSCWMIKPNMEALKARKPVSPWTVRLLGSNARVPKPRTVMDVANSLKVSTCSPLRIYVYPDDGVSVLSQEYSDVLRIVRSSSFTVADPAEACLFLPSFDTTPLTPYYRGGMSSFGTTLAQLRKLAHWNDGVNHVVLDLTDSRAPWAGRFDSAIMFKSAWDSTHYVAGHDVAFPLAARSRSVSLEVRRQFETRRHLACFAGTMWNTSLGISPIGDTRRTLLGLHDGHEIVVMDPADHPQGIPYTDLLSNCQFGIVPRGAGLHSYRFIEVLNAGCIPVVLADDWVMPFSEVAVPDSYSVRYPESRAGELRELLRAIPLSRKKQLHASVLHVYHHVFSNSWNTALTLLQYRLQNRK